MSDSDPTQYALFDLGPFEEPDTLTKAEYQRFRSRLLEAPPAVGGRPYENVEVAGGRL